MQEKKIALVGAHIRGARAILQWTLEDLAARTGVTLQTLHVLEHDKHKARKDTQQKIRRAFEEAGIEFTNGTEPGVKLRQLNGNDKH